MRVRRYIAKYTVNPAIAHGMGEHIGSIEVSYGGFTIHSATHVQPKQSVYIGYKFGLDLL